jgi:hypothetical protein
MQNVDVLCYTLLFPLFILKNILTVHIKMSKTKCQKQNGDKTKSQHDNMLSCQNVDNNKTSTTTKRQKMYSMLTNRIRTSSGQCVGNEKICHFVKLVILP